MKRTVVVLLLFAYLMTIPASTSVDAKKSAARQVQTRARIVINLKKTRHRPSLNLRIGCSQLAILIETSLDKPRLGCNSENNGP